MGAFLLERTISTPSVVVVIDSLLARTYFPDRDAVGQSLTIPHWGAARNVAARVVGVVGHVEHYGLDGSLGEKPQIYYAFYQLPDEAVPVFRGEVTLAMRTSLDAATVMPAIRNAVYEAGSDQPVYNIRTMQELVSGSMGRQRFPMLLLVAFAVLALLLACVGIYGVISYSVTERVREIGIRMALGAEKRDVLRMMVGQGLRLAVAGVAIGCSSSIVFRPTAVELFAPALRRPGDGSVNARGCLACVAGRGAFGLLHSSASRGSARPHDRASSGMSHQADGAR